MKTLNIKILACMLFSIFLVSCELTDAPEPIEAKQETTHLLSDESTDEDPNISYTYGPIVKVNNQAGATYSSSSDRTSFSNAWTRITRSDLLDLGRDVSMNFLEHNDMKNRFRDLHTRGGDRRPANVCVNDVQVGSSGRNPNKDYGWYAEVRSKGTRKSKNTSNLTGWKKVAGTSRRSERNKDSEGRWMELPGEWRITVTEENNWNVTGTISTKVGGEAGVPLVTKGTVEVSVSLAAGGGGSKSYSVTEVLKGGRIWIPAGKVANWEASERHRTVETVWHVPLEFRGMVGADYGWTALDGSHYWAISASNFFSIMNSKKYIIDVEETTDTEIRVRSWITDN